MRRTGTGSGRRSLVALVAILALVATACGLDHHNPRHRGTPAPPGPLPALHAEPDAGSSGRITDARAREVLLRGVSINSFAEYWRYGEFETTFPFTRADARMIAGTGWNAVRLLVSWSRVEPEPGHYDEAYLDRIAGAVDRLARNGVYSIIDLHQDAWGPSLAARPGEDCGPGTSPAFGWDGAPAWATLDGGAARCTPAGIRELSPAVRAAFGAFWADAPGPGGVGIRTRYVRMLGQVAERFAHESAVAGFDVMNEPNAFGGEELAALSDLYGDAIGEIRAGERRAGGLRHLVFVEPSITWSDVGVGRPPPFPHDGQVVYAPHIYRGGLTPGPVPREDFERARSDAAALGGAPVLVGEWGANPSRAADPDDDYFRRHQQLQDEFGFSATYWGWKESCGDPHKASEVRAGEVPYPWGLFRVDCRTNTALGLREALHDQLSRPYARSSPGRLTATAFDPATGHFEARGVDAPRHSWVVAWIPGPWRCLRPDTEGLWAVHTRPRRQGGMFLIGLTRGGPWRLSTDVDSASCWPAFPSQRRVTAAQPAAGGTQGGSRLSR